MVEKGEEDEEEYKWCDSINGVIVYSINGVIVYISTPTHEVPAKCEPSHISCIQRLRK